jgi:hypothetical protein
MDKIREFRRIAGDFPLIAGAGMTPETIRESLPLCNGAIVGSWFKEGHLDIGAVCEEHVKAFMAEVRALPVSAPSSQPPA